MKIKNIYLSVDSTGDITIYQRNKFLGLTTSIRSNFLPLDSTETYIMTNTINSIIKSIVVYENFKFIIGGNPYEEYIVKHKDLKDLCLDFIVVRKIGEMIKKKKNLLCNIVDNYDTLEFLTTKISEYRLYLDATKYKQSIKTNMTFYIIYREALKEYDMLVKELYEEYCSDEILN